MSPEWRARTASMSFVFRANSTWDIVAHDFCLRNFAWMQ